MLKKVFALIFTLAFTFTVIGTATYAADTNGNNNEDAAVATTNDDDDMDWGWIGLIGLAGLMGLKRRDDRRN